MTDLLTENARLRAALEDIYEITVEPAETDHKNVRGWIEVTARNALATPAPDAVQEAARVPEIAALIEAAKAATVVLAEHEPYPLPVLHNLLLKLDAVDVAILRAKEAGQ